MVYATLGEASLRDAERPALCEDYTSWTEVIQVFRREVLERLSEV